MSPWLLRIWISVLGVCLLSTIVTAESWTPGQPPPAKSGARTSDPALAVARLADRGRALFDDGSPSLQRRRLEGVRAPAALNAVAVLVDFADSCFYGRADEFPGPLPVSTQSDFYYAAHDSVYYDHLLRDVREYFTAVSAGRFQLEFTVHATVAGLAEGMAYYGDHPEAGEQSILLAADAIAALDSQIDFSDYDTVFLIHAGAGEETDVLDDSPEQIYSTYLGPEDFQRAVEDSVLQQPYIPTDDYPAGEGIRHVLILPENEFQDAFEGYSGYYGSLGVYCFEVGLRLGMLSLTDFTPAGSPDSQGIGQFGLMGYGLFSAGGFVPPHPCAFNKQLMGWLEPYPVDPDAAATWTLQPSEFPAQSQAAARIDLTGAEYYLLEYRLQDPDGNRIFSFAGDLNHNNVPDFYDADSATGDGRPTGFFDPATDVREWFTGAEWDFFLSDNTARAPGVKGAGSGIYIWHIDEGVIRAAFGQERNLFNADPQRKSVDVEEADGIQDLDTREPSPYWLGADDDSFRGEGNATFGPDGRPDTRTNGQIPSGLLVDEIANVVADSAHVFNPGSEAEYVGIRYAESMTFRCRRLELAADVASALAARELPGVDLRGSHLLAAPLLDAASGLPVLVAAADSGRIYACTVDLAEWVDHDGDASTFAPLAVGTDPGGQPVAWHLPLAVGQLDPADPALEIVATADEGLYAFRQDGTPLAGPGGATDYGLVVALARTTLPPVLLPLGDGETLDTPVAVCTGTVEPGVPDAPTRLRFLDHAGAEIRPSVTLAGVATVAPVRAGRTLFLVVQGADGTGLLQAVTWPSTGDPAVLWTVELDVQPGERPPLVTPAAVVVMDAAGGCQTVDVSRTEPVVDAPWSASVVVESPIGPGGGFLGDGQLGRVTEQGVWQQGWPRRPLPAIEASAAQPLVLGDADDPAGFLFTTRDGRLYLTRPDGATDPGWPIAGPADGSVTPVAVMVEGEGQRPQLVLAAAGTTPQIAGVDPDANELAVGMFTRLRTWRLTVDAALHVPGSGAMYGGSPWRGGAVPRLVSLPADGAPPLAASHVCYPQPLVDDVLRVRGLARADGDARAVILNLQGEVVRDTGRFAVRGGMPFEAEVDFRGVAAGLYLCKLSVGSETSVKTIAVAR